MFIDESIFKNKDYGAYVLRKKYYRFTLISLIISIVLIFLIFFFPLIIQFNRQMNIEHTRLRPTQVPMELLDIPPELMKQKEQLPAQQEKMIEEQVPENDQNNEAISPVITDSSKITSTDTLAQTDTTAIENKQAEEGIFECGSNLLNFRMWFMQHFQFPVSDKIKKTEGRAMAIFIVNEKGYIDSVNIVSGIDPLIDSAIKNTLLSSPRWKPCSFHGKPIKQLYHFPVYLVRKI